MYRSNLGSLYIRRSLFTCLLIFNTLYFKVFAENFPPNIDKLIGDKARLGSVWKGTKVVPKNIPILILAGHADSQGISGAGTAGYQVGIKGANQMDQSISDELYWNIKIRDEIVRIGKEKGLVISSYDPGIRNIIDGNNSITNWSVGAKHIRSGGYALEVHFDSYGEYGFGSGLIPALSAKLNYIDESLANSFGRYPLFFRGGLGGPRRGIRILEIGKLEGQLENFLRNPLTRKKTIFLISNKVVEAILVALK